MLLYDCNLICELCVVDPFFYPFKLAISDGLLFSSQLYLLYRTYI